MAQGPAEQMFLIDNQVQYDGESRLYRVDLDEETRRADLTLLPNGILPYDQCHLACSPDGAACYLVNKFAKNVLPDGGQLIRYDLASGVVTEVGLLVDPAEPRPVDPVDRRVPNAVLAGFDIAGTMYVASAVTDKLYTVDVTTGVATCVGRPVIESPDGSLTVVNVQGGDLAFTSDDRLFLWANKSRDPGAPGDPGGFASRGLYELFLTDTPDCTDDLATDHRLRAEFVFSHEEGPGPEDVFYGLGVRYGGLGALVLGSGRQPVSSEMHVHGRDGGDSLTDHVFNVRLEGAPFSVGAGGDLSTGFLETPGACPARIKEIRFEYTGAPCSSPAASDNDQTDTFFCRRDLGGEEPVRVLLRRKPERSVVQPSTEDVKIGGWVSVATADARRRLYPDLILEIRQGGELLQVTRVHTSCSQPLAVGDQFGSLVVRQIISQ